MLALLNIFSFLSKAFSTLVYWFDREKMKKDVKEIVQAEIAAKEASIAREANNVMVEHRSTRNVVDRMRSGSF